MPSEQEYREIYISKDEFDALRSNPKFAAILTLARVVNSLQFCFSTLIENKDADTPTKSRQFLNSTMFACGVLHEGLEFVEKSLEKHFADNEAYCNGLKTLISSSDVKLFRKNVLEKLRHKSVFHFDKGFALKTIKSIDLPEYVFASSLGSKRGEIYYNLADETSINYLLLGAKPEDEASIMREMLEQLSDVLAKFSDHADKLIAHVLIETNWRVRVK